MGFVSQNRFPAFLIRMNEEPFTFRLGVVILGAGFSSRMGCAKLLLPWRDTSVLGAIVEQWNSLGAVRIVVVRREDDSALASELTRLGVANARSITNPFPERGMFSSIRRAAAFAAEENEITHWALALGDQPQIDSTILRRLMEFARENPARICQPCREGLPKHPLVFPREMFITLENDEALSLKDFLSARNGVRSMIELDDPTLEGDLDTPEDYKWSKRMWG
jgi:molybdenum cofactor cytidylyltransferase